MKLFALALIAAFGVAHANPAAVDCKKTENSAKPECAHHAEAAKVDAAKAEAAKVETTKTHKK